MVLSSYSIRSLLLIAPVVLLPSSLVSGEQHIVIEDFSADETKHVWFSVNDPVMGGLSTGYYKPEEGYGVFTGQVKDVPSLGAPGFISMRTGRGGFFPDVSSCDGLILRVKSKVEYDGYRASFGTKSASAMPYANGFKTRFGAPVGAFGDVTLPFTEFSDNWDAATGDTIVSCEENNQYCPDDVTLRNFEQLEIMGEGVSGEIDLEIEFIHAYACDDNIDPYANQPDYSGGGTFSGNGAGGRPADNENAVGGSGGYMTPTILENGDIRIESFDNPQHLWFANNDPVMGGNSTATATIQNDVGILDGEVVDVPFLSAPGFIKMETRGGLFPDVSMCKALKINWKSANDYDGIRVTFGTHHADDAMPYIRGYKAHLDPPPKDTFGEVIMPFTMFSDSWDSGTGIIVTSCAKDPTHCVDEETLKDFTTFSFMGEGVDGKVHLEIKSIDATDCTHSISPSVNVSIDENETSSSWSATIIILCFVVIVFFAFFAGRCVGRKSQSTESDQGAVTPKSDIV